MSGEEEGRKRRGSGTGEANSDSKRRCPKIEWVGLSQASLEDELGNFNGKSSPSQATTISRRKSKPLQLKKRKDDRKIFIDLTSDGENLVQSAEKPNQRLVHVGEVCDFSKTPNQVSATSEQECNSAHTATHGNMDQNMENDNSSINVADNTSSTIRECHSGSNIADNTSSTIRECHSGSNVADNTSSTIRECHSGRNIADNTSSTIRECHSGSNIADQSGSTSINPHVPSEDASNTSEIEKSDGFLLKIHSLCNIVISGMKELEDNYRYCTNCKKSLVSVSTQTCSFTQESSEISTRAEPSPATPSSPSTSIQSDEHLMDLTPSQGQAHDLLSIEKKLMQGLKKKVTICVCKCAITDPPEIGKTCLKHLLLGLPRPPIDRSTALSTTAEEVTPDIDEVSLAPQIQATTDCIAAEEFKGTYKWGTIDRPLWAKLIANTIHQLSNCSSETSAISADIGQSNDIKIKGFNKMVRTQLKRMPANTKKRKTMDKMRLVYLVDTGGQPQFQEILPNFIRSSVNILVHKLSQHLNDCPGFSYNGVRYDLADDMKVSNLSIIEQSVRSVCSTVRNTDKTNQGVPSIAVVGTFEDKFKENCRPRKPEEVLKERSKTIFSCLNHFISNIKTCRLLSYKRNQQIIYPVDGSESGWENNTKVVDELKGIIQRSTGTEITIPIWYIVFLQEIKTKNKKKYITMKECCEIAENCLVSPSLEDVQEALTTFHEMNVILYFADSLEDLIFVEPSFLYQVVTDIIVKSFQSHEMDFESRKFNTTGIMTKSFLNNIESFRKLQNNAFTQDHLLKLLKDILIIADLGNDKYFMPCVLPLQNPDEIEASICHNDDIEGPLVVSFGDRISPRGLFCSMIVDLQQCHGWELVEEDQVQKRNKIVFNVTQSVSDSTRQFLGTTTIIDRDMYLEVYTICPKNDCILVHHAVRNSLHIACQKMKYSPHELQIELGFICISKKCTKNPQHNTACSYRKEWVETCKFHNSYIQLTPKKAAWFSKTELDSISEFEGPSKEIKNDYQVLNEITMISHKWKEIASSLFSNMNEVKRIECDYLLCKDRLFEVILYWKNHDHPSFTWKTLVNVLRSQSVNEFGIANTIEQKYIHHIISM